MENHEDPQLSKLLKSWDISPSQTTGFERGVWQKIADRNAGKSASWSWLTGLFLRPQYALALIFVVAFSGIALGLHKANIQSQVTEARAAQAYLFSIDPVNRHYASLNP